MPTFFFRKHGFTKTGTDIFRKPTALFKKYLEELYRGERENRVDFLAFVAIWASENNRISKNKLQNSANTSNRLKMVTKSYCNKELDDVLLKRIKLTLEFHIGGFLEFSDQTEEYMFSHTVIGDMVGVVLGKEQPDIVLEICPVDFLMERVTLKKECRDKEYMVVLKEREYDYLAKRCFTIMCDTCAKTLSYNTKESTSGAFEYNTHKMSDMNIINHDAFEQDMFVEVFLNYSNEEH